MNTLLDDKVDSVVFEEKMVRPAKHWRNRWWAPIHFETPRGTSYGPGFVWSEKTHPSKELAENDAQIAIEANAALDNGIQYIGAFPLPVTP